MSQRRKMDRCAGIIPVAMICPAVPGPPGAGGLPVFAILEAMMTEQKNRRGDGSSYIARENMFARRVVTVRLQRQRSESPATKRK